MPIGQEGAMPYNDYGSWLKRRFGYKVQKLSIDAGFTCPNRDGSIGSGGCIYCNNESFNPTYCNRSLSVGEQLERGKDFFKRKYPEMRYLAYFQAFTNTYASLDHLKRIYDEALSVDDIVGLIIGTRPDCITTALLNHLEQINRHKMVTVEYGVETANDATLRYINRGHTFVCSRRAMELTAERGITTGAHIIIGLPNESPEESIQQAHIMSSLPIDVLKIHQMQIIRGTKLAEIYAANPFRLYTPDEYIDIIINYLERLRADMVIERFASQSPKHLLVAPQWGLKNHELTNLIVNRMKREGRHQGSLSSLNNKSTGLFL